ncbi:ATP-binding protein [Luteimonas salinilitoris]|uniref:ATP-binding protein n=1 Tax=Luteimonas salinilitoris TaxID=3237697 RepID=A0ABV4HUC7_9GAMM
MAESSSACRRATEDGCHAKAIGGCVRAEDRNGGGRRDAGRAAAQRLRALRGPLRCQRGALFRLATYRYDRVAILITTNKSIRDWTELLAGDEALDAAILDRLLHKAHVHSSRLGNGSFRPILLKNSPVPRPIGKS